MQNISVVSIVCTSDITEHASLDHLNNLLRSKYEQKPRYYMDTTEGIVIWDLEIGRVTNTIDCYHSVLSLLELPNNRFAITCDDDTIRIFEKYTCAKILRGHALQITCTIFTRDGKLISASVDGTIRLWNLHDMSNTIIVQQSTPPKIRPTITEMYDGSFAYILQDNSIRIMDKHYDFLYKLPEMRLPSKLLGLSTGDLAIAKQNTIRVWQTETRKVKLDIDTLGHVVSMEQVSKHVILSAGNEKIKTFSLVTGICLRVFDGRFINLYPIKMLPFQRIAAIRDRNTLVIVDSRGVVRQIYTKNDTAPVPEIVQKTVSLSFMETILWFIAKLYAWLKLNS